MPHYTISLGSNLPDGEVHVSRALKWLSEEYVLRKVSPTYVTPDIKDASAPFYTNAVAVIESDIDADKLNSMLKAYENRCGRIHGSATVLIDLDLVLRDSEILRPNDYAAPYFRQGLSLLS